MPRQVDHPRPTGFESVRELRLDRRPVNSLVSNSEGGELEIGSYSRRLGPGIRQVLLTVRTRQLIDKLARALMTSLPSNDMDNVIHNPLLMD